MYAPALLGSPLVFTFSRPCLTLSHRHTCLLERNPEKQDSPSEGRDPPIGITQEKSCASPTAPPRAPCKQPSKTRGLSHQTKSNCVSACLTTPQRPSPEAVLGRARPALGTRSWSRATPTFGMLLIQWEKSSYSMKLRGVAWVWVWIGGMTRNSGWKMAEGRMESFSQPGCSSR